MSEQKYPHAWRSSVGQWWVVWGPPSNVTYESRMPDEATARRCAKAEEMEALLREIGPYRAGGPGSEPFLDTVRLGLVTEWLARRDALLASLKGGGG